MPGAQVIEGRRLRAGKGSWGCGVAIACLGVGEQGMEMMDLKVKKLVLSQHGGRSNQKPEHLLSPPSLPRGKYPQG